MTHYYTISHVIIYYYSQSYIFNLRAVADPEMLGGGVTTQLGRAISCPVESRCEAPLFQTTCSLITNLGVGGEDL